MNHCIGSHVFVVDRFRVHAGTVVAIKKLGTDNFVYVVDGVGEFSERDTFHQHQPAADQAAANLKVTSCDR